MGKLWLIEVDTESRNMEYWTILLWIYGTLFVGVKHEPKYFDFPLSIYMCMDSIEINAIPKII